VILSDNLHLPKEDKEWDDNNSGASIKQVDEPIDECLAERFAEIKR